MKTATMNQETEVATEILGQIPKMTKWELAITRVIALSFSDLSPRGGAVLHLGGASVTHGKRVEIRCNASDLYDIEVYFLGKGKNLGKKLNVVSASDIYAENMAETVRNLVFKGGA